MAVRGSYRVGYIEQSQVVAGGLLRHGRSKAVATNRRYLAERR